MKCLALVTVLVLGACGPTFGRGEDGPDRDPVEEAIALYGQVSETCADAARGASVESVSFDDMPRACGGVDEGCTRWIDGAAHIWLVEGASGWTFTHEAIHALLFCDKPEMRGDPNHTDPAWARLDVARFRDR
jgi:hypothetical protein